jgi:AraC family transcriptional regulator
MLVDDIIEARMEDKLTVQELATSLGPSTGFLSRAFKAAVGKTPHDYIVDRRISRARALLRSGEIGPAEVAAAAGFASHAHMASQFRNRLGVTPDALRERPRSTPLPTHASEGRHPITRLKRPR